jgi:hypothetical protein
MRYKNIIRNIKSRGPSGMAGIIEIKFYIEPFVLSGKRVWDQIFHFSVQIFFFLCKSYDRIKELFLR